MAQKRITIGKKTSGANAWLYENAAYSYFRALQDGLPAGGISDAGRTFEEQTRIYNTWRSQLHLPVAQRVYKAYAAVPGTSKHESGRALDLSGAARAWMRANGAKYGWMRDRVKNEPWHFEYEWWNDTQTWRGNPREQSEEDDSMSAADVAHLKEWMTQVFGLKPGQNLPMELLGGNAYYQVKNPVSGRLEGPITALETTYRYAVLNHMEIAAVKAAVKAMSTGDDIDPAEVAAAIAPLLVDAVTEAVAEKTGGLTEEQVREASEQAMRNVLGSLGPGSPNS